MSRDAWLRLAFLALHPDRVTALLAASGSVEGALRRLGPDRRIPEAADCRARVAAWGGAFDLRRGAPWEGRFAHLPDAPHWLFREGQLGGTSLMAIVGTRSCTEYGRRVARRLAEACVASGWGVVSGLARGIDAAAHDAAVAAGGRTIAVLGSGPDVAYPRRHGELRRAILAAGGAIVTEYPPGAEPLPWRFPPRNRLISGLAAAVIVVESGESGGSLSTAARALAQGRTVMAVPGDVDREMSVGCNRLIRDGAVPVLGPEDLRETLALLG
jgi:DNA processing protein